MKVICTRCKRIKEEAHFGKDKNRKNGLTVWCKECYREYRNENRDKIRRSASEYYRNNKEKLAKYSRQWKKDNPDKVRDQKRRHMAKHRDKIREHRKEYRKKHKEEIREYNKKYRKENKDDIRKYSRIYRRTYDKRRESYDLPYKLRRVLRGRVRVAMQDHVNGKRKAGSAVKDLGCTIEEFVRHIERQWQEGMTWENYGEWELDHILPLSRFDLDRKEEFIIAANYTNIQPLWGWQNREKSNKLKEGGDLDYFKLTYGN